LSQVPQEGNIN